MKIAAHIENQPGRHSVRVSTNGSESSLSIPPKEPGAGSSVNGGELLFLALATCFCNDLYREAGKRGIKVNRVTVSVEGEFGGEGEAARNISYSARVDADASEAEIRELVAHTDTVAEIQNTVRMGVQVTLKSD